MANSFDHAALSALLGIDTCTFNAGKGDSRESFPKPLSDFTLAQIVSAFTYGCQQKFNDWRAPLLAKVKDGSATLPPNVESGDTPALFAYWWANIFGQARERTSSGSTLAGSVEKQAIHEYLASRPAAFGKLYSERWVDPKELTPRGKAKSKAKPATLATLKDCLSAISNGPISESKWLEVQANITERKAAITAARAEAEAQAATEEQAPEDLF